MAFKAVILVSLLLNLVSQSEEATSRIFARAIYCKYNPTYISYQKCFIRAVRGKSGLVNVFAVNAKPLYDVWIYFELFYQFGTIYRQWLFKMDIDVCGLSKGTSNNKVVQMAINAYKMFDPNVIRPCPNEGLNISDQDADTVWQHIAPPGFPAGHYKIEFDLHTKQNITMSSIVLKLEIRALGANELTMLNMG